MSRTRDDRLDTTFFLSLYITLQVIHGYENSRTTGCFLRVCRHLAALSSVCPSISAVIGSVNGSKQTSLAGSSHRKPLRNVDGLQHLHLRPKQFLTYTKYPFPGSLKHGATRTLSKVALLRNLRLRRLMQATVFPVANMTPKRLVTPQCVLHSRPL